MPRKRKLDAMKGWNPDKKPTPRQARFVVEYLVDLNATAAARRSGCSEKSAAAMGYEYLQKPHIAKLVAAGQAQQLARAELSASRVLEEMRRLAFMDIRQLFDADGNLRPIHLLTEEAAAAIAGMEVIIKNAEAGDGVTDKVHKVKLCDKTRALEMLGKHFKLLTDTVNVTADDALIERLLAGRKRAAEARVR
jgi:phage terminase small subunit